MDVGKISVGGKECGEHRNRDTIGRIVLLTISQLHQSFANSISLAFRGRG